MKADQHIQYLRQTAIDRQKWDACIDHASNGRIYNYSWYLDCMTAHWDGLVYGDYEAVMPLPWKKKWGIRYIYQPPFIAQTGITGNNLNAGLIEAFIQSVSSRFRYAEINFNSGNIIPDTIPGSLLRDNYVLKLQQPYAQLAAAYRENARRNIRKTAQTGCITGHCTDPDAILELAAIQMNRTDKEVPDALNRFRKLYALLLRNKQAQAYSVELKGRILASCIIFYANKRIYYILVGNHPDGKTIGASHALIDLLIREHAGQDLLLDFEGSDIRNLAFFYTGFGAVQETYPALKLNRLPALLKWLKQ